MQWYVKVRIRQVDRASPISLTHRTPNASDCLHNEMRTVHERVQVADIQNWTIPAGSLRNEEQKAVEGGIVQFLILYSHDRPLL